MWDDRRRLSVSQLGTYSRCPMLYRLQKIDRVPSPPAAWTIKGTAVHDTIEEWERQGRPESFDLVAFFEARFEVELQRALGIHPDTKEWIRTPRTVSAERDLELRFVDGIREVSGYAERAIAESHLWQPLRLEDGTVAVELPFTLDFTTFTVVGRIDIVQRWSHDGSVTVGDYKTGSDASENYRQLGVYRLALLENYGLDVSFGRYIYTKLDRSSPWIDLRRYTREYVMGQFAALDRAITYDVFPPAPEKKKCFLCSVRPHCEEMKDN